MYPGSAPGGQSYRLGDRANSSVADGDYFIRGTTLEAATTKDGAPQLKASGIILGGPQNGRPHTWYYSLTEQSLWRLFNDLIALGLDQSYDPGPPSGPGYAQAFGGAFINRGFAANITTKNDFTNTKIKSVIELGPDGMPTGFGGTQPAPVGVPTAVGGPAAGIPAANVPQAVHPAGAPFSPPMSFPTSPPAGAPFAPPAGPAVQNPPQPSYAPPGSATAGVATPPPQPPAPVVEAPGTSGVDPQGNGYTIGGDGVRYYMVNGAWQTSPPAGAAVTATIDAAHLFRQG